MVTSVPAWFGSKGSKERGPKPPGVDVTSITDTSASMSPFASFITSTNLYVSLENALRAEGIGTLSSTPNRYSFTRACEQNEIVGPRVEYDVKILNPPESTKWGLGSFYLANNIENPDILIGPDAEDVGKTINFLQNRNRGYNPLNEQIIIGGSDEQSYLEKPRLEAVYPSRYVGIHDFELYVREDAVLPPRPAGDLVGFVYTTDTLGVAIYIDEDDTINYREPMPTSSFNPTTQTRTVPLMEHAIATNGAIYDIRYFVSGVVGPNKWRLLGESLGRVLGKYLYSIS